MHGLLFDLDGTLALTNPAHERAWQLTLADYGVTLSPSEFKAGISGRSNSEIVARFVPHLSLNEARQVAVRKEALFRQLAPTLDAPAGLGEFVQRSHAKGYQLAVVTNAPRANALHVLQSLNLEPHFSKLVVEEDVTKPKPNAEPYLLACQWLGLEPAQCVAFEDSPSGIKSAVAAGVAVAGLSTTHASAELLAAGASVVGTDFADEVLLSWLRGFESRT